MRDKQRLARQQAEKVEDYVSVFKPTYEVKTLMRMLKELRKILKEI